MTAIDRGADIEAIRSVIEGLSDAWEKSDGAAWGSHFVSDADFAGEKKSKSAGHGAIWSI